MTEIIQHWIGSKLGLPVSFKRGADRLRHELSNGHLFGEILRKYHLISDDMLMNLTDSVCHHDREKNMNILHHWLQGMAFEVDVNDLSEIRQGKPGAALSLLYRMYLWLEGPGSQPGIQPRQKGEVMSAPSEDTIEGRKNWIPFVTDRYLEKQAQPVDGLMYEDFLKEQRDSGVLKRRSSLVVNTVSEAGGENGEAEISLEEAESFPELKSVEFLEGLKESLSYEPTQGDKPKIFVSPVSVLSEDDHDVYFRKSTPDIYGDNKVSTISTEKSYGSSEPYIEIDDRGLTALECGHLPSHYIRNHPFGTANEKLQAGNLYFHSKAMMILDEQRMSARRQFDIPKQSQRLPCRNKTYIGAYEEALLYRLKRKRTRSLMVMEDTINEMNKFDEKLQENSGITHGACEDFTIKIYPNGRGDWNEASLKINVLKNRRKREKICFQKRCSTRKMIAGVLAKSDACEMSEELDKTIHSKLILRQSRQEIWLAEYCTASHIEKRVFLDHVKFEEEQLLSMAMEQMYKQYLHAEQLEIIKNKVDAITEECDERIMNEVQIQKRKAQFIMDIKFCEEIFMVILKTAIQYSDYCSEYRSDPPTALVAEWRESFYLGSCVTMVKEHIKKDEKAKRKTDEYADEHAKRCKKKKRAKKAKEAMKSEGKKSKSSITSLKSKSRHSSELKILSAIMEYVEEEELPVYHTHADEKPKKKKHSLRKSKHTDVHKIGSNESKTSNHSGKDVKKSSSDIANETTGSKIQKKKHAKDSKINKKKTSLNVNSIDMNSDSKNIPDETTTKGKKRNKPSIIKESKQESKDLTEDKETEENQTNNEPSTTKKKKEANKEKSKTGEKPGKKPAKAKAGKEDKKAKKTEAAKNGEVDNDEEEEDEMPEAAATNEEPVTEKKKKEKKPVAKSKKPEKNN